MKKFLSLIMLVALTLGMPTNSLAAEGATITQDSQDKSGKINVDYNMEESYTVIFPASVTFTDMEKTVDRGLQASNVVLNEGSSLNVNVASLNNFKMRNGDGYIDYKLLVNTHAAPEENNYTILTVEAGEGTGLAIISFTTELEKKNALYAGNYTDILTFTVSID